jgi:NAD(P)-dependent dehydrogenase (short-subunit alcohol dehydrogenase family)
VSRENGVSVDRGRTAIVTGAGRGIGRTLALGLVEAGLNVVLMDRDPETLRATQTDAEAIARSAAVAITGDVTCEADAERALAAALAAFGRIDALVNNAGIGRHWIRGDFLQRPIPFWELTVAQWRRFIDVNATGWFVMTSTVLPVFLRTGSGSVVTVTTSLDTMIGAGCVGYGGAKAAVEATMATLAADLAGTRIRANVLVPGGPVDTPAFPDDGIIPRSAFIRPEAMLPPLRWLLSERAEGVSGQRFVARLWDEALTDAECVRIAGAPIAWPQLGTQSVLPHTS